MYSKLQSLSPKF